MASLTITGIQPHVSRALRERARARGRSIEEEARSILESSMGCDDPGDAVEGDVDIVGTIRREMAAIGGVDLTLPQREPMAEPMNFRDSGSA